MFADSIVGRPAFVASFYARNGLVRHARAAFDSWLRMLPAKTEGWCAAHDPESTTEDSFGEALELSASGIEHLRRGLSPERISLEDQWYVAKSDYPDPTDERHGFSLELLASAVASHAYATFPLHWVARQGVAAVVEWFRHWCEAFEFTNGGAGFGYDITLLRDLSHPLGPAILDTGLRYHGVRVWERRHARLRGQVLQSLDTAAWLTFLDKSSLATVGEQRIGRIDPGVAMHSCGAGLILQASAEPDPCDSTQPNAASRQLKSVNDAIVPIRSRKWAVSGWSGDVLRGALRGMTAVHAREDSWFSRMDAPADGALRDPRAPS